MPNKSSGGNAGKSSGHKMTTSDAARIQAAQAKGGHDMSAKGFAARAQAAAAHNANANAGGTGKDAGKQ